jgi:hypothetical protein
MMIFKKIQYAISLALPAWVLILSCAKVNNNNTLTENATLKFTVSGYKLLDMAKDGSWFAGYDETNYKVAGFSGTNGSKIWEYTIPKVWINTYEGPEEVQDWVSYGAKITDDGNYIFLACEYTKKILTKTGTVIFNADSFNYGDRSYSLAGPADISGDGSYFVQGNPLTLFTQTGQVVWCKAGDQYGSLSNNVAISRNGSYVARDDGDVYLYDFSGNLLRRIPDNEIVSNFIKFSPEGNLIFWGGLGGGKVIDLMGNTIHLETTNDYYGVFDMAIPERDSLLFVALVGKVKLYTLSSTSSLLWENDSTSGRVFSVDASSDGSLLGAIGDWGYVYIFDRNGQILFSANQDGSSGGIIRISANGRYFCAQGDGGKIYYYEMK